MQQQPDPTVVAWLDSQPAEDIWLTAITLFETRYGLALLPDGPRKLGLQQRFEELLVQDLQNRIAQFDDDAAAQAAVLAAHRKTIGRPVDIRDTFIAGIALARQGTLATRNTKHFEELATPVINPWA